MSFLKQWLAQDWEPSLFIPRNAFNGIETHFAVITRSPNSERPIVALTGPEGLDISVNERRESKALASLISASPQLYHYLNEILKDYEPTTEQRRALIDEAKKAIKKAEGGRP